MTVMLNQFPWLPYCAVFLALTTGFVFLALRSTRVARLPRNDRYSVAVFSGTVFVGALVAAVGWFTVRSVRAVSLDRLAMEGRMSAEAIAAAVTGVLDRTICAAQALGGSPWIVEALRRPDPVALARANETLDRYQRTMRASVCYIMDSTGLTIASSNRSSAESFVGKDYSFRPYFRKARAGALSTYLALGVTSGVRGHYAAAPVREGGGPVLGVAVVKIDIDTLEGLLVRNGPCLLVDTSGIVFMASAPGLRYRPLLPMDPATLQQINDSRQFGVVGSEAVLRELPRSGEIRYAGHGYLLTVLPIPGSGTRVVLLKSRLLASRYVHVSATVAMAFVLCVYIAGLLITVERANAWTSGVIQSEQRFRTLFENAPEAVWVIDAQDGRFIDANPLALKALGVDEQALHARRIVDVLLPERGIAPLPFPPCTPATVRGIFRCRRAGDAVAVCSVSSAQVRHRERDSLLVFVTDITAVVETQRALRESEERFRSLSEFLPETVFETDLTGRMTYVNKSGFRQFGYTEEDLKRGVNVAEFVAPADRARAARNVRAVLESRGPTQPNEYTGVRSDGTTFPFMVHSSVILRDGVPVGLRGIAVDLTERRRLELEMQRAGKLEALGILAGGLAHDFNNLLTGVWAGLSLVKMRTAGDRDLAETVADLENAVKRGKDLTTQLLTYSRGGAPLKQSMSLRQAVEETARFALSGSACRHDLHAAENLWPVDADAGQISQVVQNLLINAVQAMPDGGAIVISLDNCLIEAGRAGALPLAPGRYVHMSVTDQGPGIPEAHQAHIFDPFYTTREGGTGLGLATTYSIITRHGGHISVESGPGTGTTFHVYLPAAREQPAAGGQESAVVRGRGRILLMDDDPLIRMVGRRLLESLGYTVTVSDDGEQAVRAYEAARGRGERFDAVILDLTVKGGLGGKEAVRLLRGLDPNLKAIVSSGYFKDPVMAEYAEYGFDAVISKPYNVEELSRTVNGLLARGRTVEGEAAA